jgi:ubiquinol-cytochrome c reductase cytochrome b subunit
LIFGGRVPAAATIPRLYSLHIFVIPSLIAILATLHLAIIWRQLHTNYPGPGRSNAQIAGSRLWPVYATKALGLFFIVFAALSALGGLVQINPVWIYGPFDPTAILPGAQPDWYLGWNEGALRLFPGINLQFWGRLIPEVFFPGVLLPILIFIVLYAYPFIEAWLTGENAEQHVLQLPWERPGRTALGFAAFTGLFMLFVAGGQDVLAVVFGQPLELIRRILRILVVAVPICAAVMAYVVCLAIDRIQRTPG